MTMRMTMAAGLALLLAGSTFAQSSYPTPPQYATGEAMPSSLPDVALPPGTVFPPSAAPASPAGPGRFWASGDYLASWITGAHLPALVTTSPAGTSRATAGVLGKDGTGILFGDSIANNDIRSGARLGLGYWMGEERRVGLEAGFSVLESQSALFSSSSTTFPILGRPYTDATNFTAQAALVAFPSSSTGTVDVRAWSGNFYEGHLDLAVKLGDAGGPFRVDGLIGYRYYRFDEGLRIRQSQSPTNANFFAGTLIQAQDDFVTHNEFHGADFGVRPRFVWQSLSLDLLAKVAVGNLSTMTNIQGATLITVPGSAPVPLTGGVYALGTNINSYRNNDLAVLPEFGATLGWRISQNVQVRIGYSGLMLNGAAQVANQVNTTINPNRFAGGTPPSTGLNEPGFYLNRTNPWVHGVTLGFEVAY